MNLLEKSLSLILENQAPSGAFPAALSFAPYRYCWIRDGSFVAYAALTFDRIDSCRKFLAWVDRAISRYATRIDDLETWLSPRLQAIDGERVPMFLPARYDLDGFEVRDTWPNFQIDGYGTWLWCLSEFLTRTGDDAFLRQLMPSVRLTLRYLSMTWRLPNFDCWEENCERIHPSTLSCLYGGIKGINDFLGELTLNDLAAEIRNFVIAPASTLGRLPKYIGSTSVDASLLWAAVPFSMLDVADPLMVNTVRLIEQRLLEKGGVKRYPEDTYYGGGQWVLLSCWLGWYYLRSGRPEKAESMLAWVEAQADGEGNLPEQVATNVNDPAFVMEWERRWGPAARPLLWSHAMYIIVAKELAAWRRDGSRLTP